VQKMTFVEGDKKFQKNFFVFGNQKQCTGVVYLWRYEDSVPTRQGYIPFEMQ